MKKILLLLLMAMFVMSGCSHKRADLKANDLAKNGKSMSYGGAIQRNSPDPIEREAGESIKRINAFVIAYGTREIREQIVSSKTIY